LDALRLPHFEDLSDALITAVKADPAVFSGEILQMHCPMAKGNQGADWLQSGEPLRNPYFGAAMPGCGEVKGNLAVTSNGHAGHGH
jgi:Cu(I)/Ag(I) efflux system membrane fusion protein